MHDVMRDDFTPAGGGCGSRRAATRPLPLLLIAALGAAWLAPGAAGAADFLVDSTLDQPDVSPGDGICDAAAGAATTCTLRAAIQEANALPNLPGGTPPHDRIGIPGGTYTLAIPGRDEDAAATGDLDITETVEVLGTSSERPTLDGGDLDRVLDVLVDSPHAVLIADVVVRGGHADGIGTAAVGGGIRCYGTGQLLVFRAVLRENFSSTMGGGLHSESCTTQVVSSTVEENTVAGEEAGGGGVGNRFGNLSLSSSTVRANVTIEDTGATGGGGLELVAVGDTNFTYIYGSSIIDNEADWGAGINTGMRTYVVNSVVAGNRGTFGGGAGIRTFAALTLTGSTVFGNHNTSATEPAGLALDGGSPSVTLDHTIVAGNTNSSGAADCEGTLASEGYNLIGSTAGCAISGTTTGNLTNVDPQLVGPVLLTTGSATTGGRPAWLPRSTLSPSVDAGNPAGATYDADANPATAEVALGLDQWGRSRPDDGDRDGAARTDIGAIESRVLLIDDLESGDACWWSVAPGCP